MKPKGTGGEFRSRMGVGNGLVIRMLVALGGKRLYWPIPRGPRGQTCRSGRCARKLHLLRPCRGGFGKGRRAEDAGAECPAANRDGLGRYLKLQHGSAARLLGVVVRRRPARDVFQGRPEVASVRSSQWQRVAGGLVPFCRREQPGAPWIPNAQLWPI